MKKGLILLLCFLSSSVFSNDGTINLKGSIVDIEIMEDINDKINKIKTKKDLNNFFDNANYGYTLEKEKIDNNKYIIIVNYI